MRPSDSSAAQQAHGHPLQQEGDADEGVGGPDQPQQLDLGLAGQDVQLDDVGDDEQRGQDEDAAQEETRVAGQAAQRPDALGPVAVELGVGDGRRAAGFGDQPGHVVGRDVGPAQVRFDRGGEGIFLQVGDDVGELGKVLEEAGQGLLRRDRPDGSRPAGEARSSAARRSRSAGEASRLRSKTTLTSRDSSPALAFEVVGQGQEDAQDQEGQADDGQGEEMAGLVLPQVVQGLPQEIARPDGVVS